MQFSSSLHANFEQQLFALCLFNSLFSFSLLSKHIHNVYKMLCKSVMASHLSYSHSPWPLGIKTSPLCCVWRLARKRDDICESCNHRCCLLLIDSLLNFIMPKGGASRRELHTVHMHMRTYNREGVFFFVLVVRGVKRRRAAIEFVLCKTAATPNLRRWVFFRWITPVPLRPAPGSHSHYTLTTHSVNAIWQWWISWN